MQITKRNGRKEKFSRDKIIKTLEFAIGDTKLNKDGLQAFLEEIEDKLYDGVKTDELHSVLIENARHRGYENNDDSWLDIANQLILNDLHHKGNRPYEKIRKISKVTKRSGYEMPLDLSKILDKVLWATKGLERVSPSELILDAHISWKEGISTKEIQDILIKTAVSKISEPYTNWTYVAARLLLDSMYHQVGKIYGTKKGTPYPHLKQYIELALTTGKYHKEFYKGYDLDDLNAYIKPERDLQFTYLGLVTLRDRYAVHTSDGKQIELPQHMFMAIAMFLAQKEKDKQLWAKKFYDLISNLYAMPATPTLSNARLARHQLSSCFVGSNDDSLKGIFDGYEEKAFLSKLGGGVGWDWSQVRASGGTIDAYEGVAKGLIPFLKIENDIVLAVDQLGCVAKNSYVKVKKDAEIVNMPIKDLQIGDLVLSYNIKTNTPEFKTVVVKHKVNVKKDDQIKLSFEDGNYIVTSKWHPFPRVTNNKVAYVRSDEMKEGDITINHKGDFVKVTSIENGDADEEFVDLTVKDNNNYFCSTDNTDNNGGNFHLIHNTRKGAFSDYIPDWHMDIFNFIKMRDNGGEERHRAQDIFPAIWYSDEFMRREMNDEMWTLFDPYDVSYLNEMYGDEFTEAYKRAEADPSIRKVRVRARELFAAIMQSAYKHGVPFAGFKDTSNKRHKNKHIGMIRSSNLCTEIFQATEPEREIYDIALENGLVISKSEFETIITDHGPKRIKDLTTKDTIDGLKIKSIEQYRSKGRTAICNLASVNLPRLTHLPDDEFYEKIYTAIRMLDNVIDVNLYPSEKIERTAKKSRAIGLGVMGEAEDLANRRIHFGSKEHEEYIKKQYGRFQAASIAASERLAKEKGPYPEWEGSEWPNPMRNGYINAIAPTSSISILSGTTSCFEPVFNRSWYEENLSGVIPVTAPHLSIDNYEFYKPAYDIDQEKSIEMHAIRSQYIDQGASFNIFLRPSDGINIGYLASLYRLAWMSGIKSVYYVRSNAPETDKEILDHSMECTGCQ